MKMYLWLCCEGWQKFGPFDWLSYDPDRKAVVGEKNGEVMVVAEESDGRWKLRIKTPGYAWSHWLINASPKHPFPDQGSLPPLGPRREGREG